jgi:hypothetical protein
MESVNVRRGFCAPLASRCGPPSGTGNAGANEDPGSTATRLVGPDSESGN